MDARFPNKDPNQPLHQALASFRHQLRKFLLASEDAAKEAGLHPQQHQLLLAVAGAPVYISPSVAYAAAALGLKHNSVVELVDRCEKEGLLRRTTDPEDRRRVCLETTVRGQQVLDRLSRVHLLELNSHAPHLIEALQKVLQNESKRQRSSSRKKLA
jgi:DNA-binding MarR family transcriptional regulator